ncbi:MAG TPA: hypothetical protein VN879_16215 [Candidatus Acidoferrales bacterium]|nr:hypothetical protein [Candidatus Acidoferrales bacterium]
MENRRRRQGAQRKLDGCKPFSGDLRGRATVSLPSAPSQNLLHARADSLFGLHGNRSESATKMTLDFKSIGAPASAKLRDFLDHKDLGTVQNSYSAEVPTHGVVLVKVSK